MYSKCALTFVVGACLSGAGLAAQATVQPSYGVGCVVGPGQQGCPAPKNANACPASMQVTHLADGSLVKTGSGHPSGIGQWLSLSFNGGNSNENQIVQAKVAVHGIKPNGHVTQALSFVNGPDNMVRTFTVPVPTGRHKDAHGNLMVDRDTRANLWVPGMSAVDRIDLVSLDYSDGSTWTVSDHQSCSVVPDPKMLITSR
jgi:hypothetical protein